MKEEIQKCIEVLKSGGIILYPTDTVWGIGCDATNEEAVKKVFDLKQRDDAKSLIVLVANDAMLNNHVKNIPELAWDLIDIATSPTTIIYDGAKNLAKNVIAKNGSIAIRMVKDNFCHQLIYNYRKPIVSTSANITSFPTPLSFNDISPEIKNHVDYVVDSKLEYGNQKPSSLIQLGLNGSVKILRR